MRPMKTWGPWEYEPKIDPAEMGLSAGDYAQALEAARQACNGDYSRYGYQLWMKLVFGKNAHVVPADRLVDRLPRIAFGGTGGGPDFTSMVLEWARYRAPNEYSSLMAFKARMLEAGWTPAMANSFSVVGRPMRRAIFGDWKPGDEDPMTDLKMPAGLDARQAAVFESMKANTAFN